MKALIILPLIVLTGCASMNPTPEEMEAKKFRVQAQHALADKPLLVLNCASGCNAVVNDPRAATYIGEIRTTGAADVAIKALDVTGSVLGKGVIGYAAASVAKTVLKEAGDKNFQAGGDINNDTHDTDIQQMEGVTQTDSHDVRGDEHVGDSNVDSGNTDNSVNSTHDPLVVTQPDPVVITAPDPVVVQPNSPIIAPTDGFEVVQ